MIIKERWKRLWAIKWVRCGERAALLAAGVVGTSAVLHADDASPIKGAMMATLQKIGGMLSFSKPSASDHNPYSGSLLKTLKHMLAYPSICLADIEQARANSSSREVRLAAYESGLPELN